MARPGPGKAPLPKKVAALLGYAYIDTGAMYRTVTLRFLESGLPFSEAAVTAIAEKISITFRYGNGVNRVFADGEEVTDAIRSLEVSRNVSKVAAVGGVRTAMVAAQRKIGNQGGVVMDGRDIGTVVFPQAELKVFLTASVEERARRRYLELKEKGTEVSLEDLGSQAISPGVMEEALAGKLVHTEKKKTALDFFTGCLCQLFDITCAPSLVLVRQQGYFRKLLDFQPGNPESARQLDQVKERLEKVSGISS